VVNHKRLFRLYCAEQLKVRWHGGRKRAKGTRRPIDVPLVPNQRWSLDFISDQLTDERRFRILTMIDNGARECVALVADTSLSGRRVAGELDEIIGQRGRPETIVSDNVSEYSSNAILEWADDTAVGWYILPPASLSRTASTTGGRRSHSFNGRLRDQLLNETLFWTLHHARVVLESWRCDYN
jgi:putative transposase